MAERVVKGDFVQIHKVILEPGARAPQVPEDTKKVPLEMKVKGFLEDDEAVLGQEVTVKTVIGRRITGKLIANNPRYTHDFASLQPELLTVGSDIRKMLKQGDFDA